MKMMIKVKVWLAALCLAGLTTTLVATDQNAPLPSLEPGQGLFLTPQERLERQQQVQATVADLRGKQASGAISAEEQVWLAQAEARGGICINGIPARMGWRMSPEQRAERQQEIQEFVAALRALKEAGLLTAEGQAQLDQIEQRGFCIDGRPRGGGRGAGPGAGQGFRGGRGEAGTGVGMGQGFRGGRGEGKGAGLGPRNGTGPRAQAGVCPRVNSPAPAPGQ
jgi:hypothetical protein